MIKDINIKLEKTKNLFFERKLITVVIWKFKFYRKQAI